MNEQQIRFELVKIMLQTGTPIGIIFEYADKLVSLVMNGKIPERIDTEHTWNSAEQLLSRFPNVKMHTDTGIPVKFE